jgi:hypothetical protein
MPTHHSTPNDRAQETASSFEPELVTNVDDPDISEAVLASLEDIIAGTFTAQGPLDLNWEEAMNGPNELAQHI